MLSAVAAVDCRESLSASRPIDKPEDFLCVQSPQDKPWDVHKLQAEQVSTILEDGHDRHKRQAKRMRECAQSLEFGWVIQESESGLLRLKLKKARFCRCRHCPICQWRRSLMWVNRFYRAFPKIYEDHPELRYLLLTLTVRNCSVLELRKTIKEMNDAWQRLVQRKQWPAVGFVRSLEITRGRDGSAHPHFHCLLAVPPGYFVGRKYLSTAKWANLWQEALRADYTPICDVRAVKPKPWEKLRRESPLGVREVMMDEIRTEVVTEAHSGVRPYDHMNDALAPKPWEVLLSAISEVIKYAVKPSDMVADPDWLLDLSDQLRNARAVALGGILRQYLKEGDEDTEQELIGEQDDGQENAGGIHFGWREDPRFAAYKQKRNHKAA